MRHNVNLTLDNERPRRMICKALKSSDNGVVYSEQLGNIPAPDAPL